MHFIFLILYFMNSTNSDMIFHASFFFYTWTEKKSYTNFI